MSSLDSTLPTRPEASRSPRSATARMTFRRLSTPRLAGTLILVLCLAGGFALVAPSLPAWIGPSQASQDGSEEADRAEPLEVEVRAVQLVPGYRTRATFTGELRAAREVELGFDLGGRIIEVLVDEGDAIETGQVVARLDLRRLESRRAELRAKKAAAEAVLAELEAGPRSEVIESAEAEVARLGSELELAEQVQSRRRDLRAHDAVSTEEFESAQTRVHALRASLAGAKSRLAELEAGTREEKKLAQAAVVSEIESALASLGVDVADAKLRSPFAGRVARRHLHEGAIVRPGESVLRLVESEALEAWVGVTERVRRDLVEGTVVEVDVAGTPREARVRTVLPTLDPATRTWTAVLEVTSPTGLAPGQIARLTIPRVVEDPGVWVPTDALVRGVRGLWSCYLAVDHAEASEARDVHRVRRADVEVLHTEGHRSLVRGDLSEGDLLILGGVHRVVPGQRVLPRVAR